MALIALGLAALTAGLSPAVANTGSRACGKVEGVPVHAHGVSCRTARHVYRADQAGNLPHGWVCSASLARCYRGEFGSVHYMWWRRTNYRLVGEGAVLGGVAYGAPTGAGWGEERPEEIYNGGDPSGLIDDVHWSSWGGVIARGHGRNSIFKPHGGYYRHQVTIQLKAKRIGQCESRRAYLRLLVREPRRPGGPLGPWRSWSGPKTICHSPY